MAVHPIRLLARSGLAVLRGVAGWGVVRRSSREAPSTGAVGLPEGPSDGGLHEPEDPFRLAVEGLRAISAEARCILWHAQVADLGGPYLDWKLKIWDEPAARRFLPIEVPPGLTFVQAWYESRLPEDKVWMGIYGDSEARAGRSYSQEFRCRMADGEIRWLKEDVSMEPLAPGRWRAVGVCVDITERKRLEEALRQRAAELVEADQRKDDFLAMLAHELRNPLAPIGNALQLLRRRGQDPATVARVLAILERQSRHLTRMTDDLLDVSRLTRRKVTLRREPLDLARLVRETVEDYRQGGESGTPAVDLDLPEAPAWIEGDATRLAQMVGNLLQNAVKFSEPDGRISVALCVQPEERDARLVVSDTGAGIPPELLPRVFEPFAQEDTSLHRSRGGLGLGLAIVKGVAELHGGTVAAESEGPGQGARLTVCLPLLECSVQRATCSVQDASSTLHAARCTLHARRVLVVEDNVDTAESLRELLELSGHTVQVAYSGAAGVAAARGFCPDVILCDLGLPGMNGYEVAAALREDPDLRDVRLIAVTGYGQDEYRRRSRDAGFDRHLTKPLDLTELERLIGG